MKRFLLAVGLACLGPALGTAQATSPIVSDTVIRFDVGARTWSWPYLLAHVGLSCRHGGVAVGTTTAPDTAAATDREGYCAGAVVEMRNSTLTLRGARGVVHVRISRAPADSTRQPRR
jgi:hypothetical protein